MKKFDIFFRKSKMKPYKAGGFILSYSQQEAANKAASLFVNKFVKVLPSIITI